nr:hypothetical protein [Pandoravirus massiliensis]
MFVSSFAGFFFFYKKKGNGVANAKTDPTVCAPFAVRSLPKRPPSALANAIRRWRKKGATCPTALFLSPPFFGFPCGWTRHSVWSVVAALFWFFRSLHRPHERLWATTGRKRKRRENVALSTVVVHFSSRVYVSLPVHPRGSRACVGHQFRDAQGFAGIEKNPLFCLTRTIDDDDDKAATRGQDNPTQQREHEDKKRKGETPHTDTYRTWEMRSGTKMSM